MRVIAIHLHGATSAAPPPPPPPTDPAAAGAAQAAAQVAAMAQQAATAAAAAANPQSPILAHQATVADLVARITNAAPSAPPNVVMAAANSGAIHASDFPPDGGTLHVDTSTGQVAPAPLGTPAPPSLDGSIPFLSNLHITPSKPLVGAAVGGGLGLLLGKRIGAVVGAVGGWLAGKKLDSSSSPPAST